MLDVFYYSTDLPSPPQKRALTFWGRIGISSYFIKKSGELPSPHQLLKDQEPEVKTSHPVHGAMSIYRHCTMAGLVLETHKSECYTEKADGDANELLMSQSPSVINKQHSDLWVSRMAGIATTYISGIGFHHM